MFDSRSSNINRFVWRLGTENIIVFVWKLLRLFVCVKKIMVLNWHFYTSGLLQLVVTSWIDTWDWEGEWGTSREVVRGKERKRETSPSGQTERTRPCCTAPEQGQNSCCFFFNSPLDLLREKTSTVTLSLHWWQSSASSTLTTVVSAEPQGRNFLCVAVYSLV